MSAGSEPAATGRAALWMLGALTSFTVMALAGREAGTHLDTFEIMLFRSLVGLITVLGVLAARGGLRPAPRLRAPGLHLARNIAHFTGQNLWFFAVSLIPMAQLFALEFTAPLWAILLAPLVLGEAIRPRGAIAAALGFAGIIIVAHPGSVTLGPGLIAAALCGIGFALSALFTRALTRQVSTGQILLWMTLIQSGLGLVCAGYDGDLARPSSATLPWLGVIGLAGLSAHLCLSSALRLAPAGAVMPIDFARLPLVAVLAAWIYGEAFDPNVFAGAALIIAGNVINLRGR